MNEIKGQTWKMNKPRKLFTNPTQSVGTDLGSRILMPCEKPSKLIEDVLQTDLFPPLIKEKSRTKSVLYRDGHEYLKPIDSIASCMTPTANKLRILNLQSRSKKTKSSVDVLDAQGNLQYPPTKFPRIEETKPKKTIADKYKPDVVKISDLLSGEYYRKLEEKEKKRKDRILKKKLEKIQELKMKEELERKHLSKMQAILPVHPDEQLQQLKKKMDNELNKPITEDELTRIKYYIFKGIRDEFIEPYNEKWIVLIKKRLKQSTMKSDQTLGAVVLHQVLSDTQEETILMVEKE